MANLRFLTDNPLTGLIGTALANRRERPPPGSAHDFSFDGLTGGRIDLSDFAGRPLLLVNTASRCGFTPQYRGLQALHARFGDRLGLVGVPSNDFGGQEPGEAGAIAQFCEVNYGVTFPMAAKVAVTGPQAHPLFRWLARVTPGGRPRWNFHKYLFDREGRLVRVAASLTPPNAPSLVRAIKELL